MVILHWVQGSRESIGALELNGETGFMVIKRYLSSHLTCGVARISEIRSNGSNRVRLEETWFHPQGGGQRSDHGQIANSRVLHVSHEGDEIDHHVDTVEGLVTGCVVPFVIDLEDRILNMVYHTAGHMLASIAESLHPGIRAVAGHHWPGQARVEFLGDLGSPAMDLALINQLVEGLIAKDLHVHVEHQPHHERGIRIGEFKEIPCGGVHVERLGQILEVQATGLKIRGDRIRLSYRAMPRTADPEACL